MPLRYLEECMGQSKSLVMLVVVIVTITGSGSDTLGKSQHPL